ncbi:hypothetical protein [Pararhizobium sp.]|uniref:hypothetical protein n=1 Tax=Pararhizobium sp. TaxID=1977563 RepID=UPI00271F7EAA|nr:hypothetical protein [Pararhizobium sp.]MDO9416191.1 hypothetical protein [Pararhizobium sp.]
MIFRLAPRGTPPSNEQPPGHSKGTPAVVVVFVVIEVRTSMQAFFEVRTSISCFLLRFVEKLQ